MHKSYPSAFLNNIVPYVGASNEKMPFCVQTIQQISEDEHCEICGRNEHPLFTIVVVKKGYGICVADSKVHKLTDNTLYCIKPGELPIVDASSDAEGFVLSFSHRFLSVYEDQTESFISSDILHAFPKTTVIPVCEQKFSEMRSIVQRMADEFEGENFGREELLRGLLKIFLLYVHRLCGFENTQCNTSSSTYLVKRFFALLEKNYINWKMVSDYARELAITANYLNETIKKVTGYPARHHIQQRVITEAKRKAVFAGMTMKEVAYKLGFDDIYHFSKYFKNVSGMNFTDFKKERLSGSMVSQQW